MDEPTTPTQAATTSGAAPSSAPTGDATGTPTADESQKGLATVAYVLTWLTGLIIFLVVKKEQRYARWNAIQAIGLGIAFFVLWIVLTILATVALVGGAGTFSLVGLLMNLLWLGLVVLVIVLAIKAYQGTPLRLPVLAEFADKHA